MTKSLSIAILNLQNELNVGSIIRTANAAGVESILIVGRKRWNKSAATGAQFKTPLMNLKTTEELINYCKDNDYSIVSLEISKDSENIFDFTYPNKTMLVVGNEGQGVPEIILNASTSVIKIPQFGEVECMNAASSASIAIYDWVRKEQANPENDISGSKFEV